MNNVPIQYFIEKELTPSAETGDKLFAEVGALIGPLKELQNSKKGRGKKCRYFTYALSKVVELRKLYQASKRLKC